MSGQALAFRVDIDPTTLSRYETGRLPVPLEVLWRASDALGIKLAVLLELGRELPSRFRPPPTTPKRIPAGDRSALDELWSQLRPHDRAVLLDLAGVMANRREKSKRRRR